MLLGWAVAALAADPLLAGLEGADSVTVARDRDPWVVSVRGRTVPVAPARSPEEERTLRALIAALIADPGLGAVEREGAASRALSVLGALEPPPVPAPRPAIRAVAVAPAARPAPAPPAVEPGASSSDGAEPALEPPASIAHQPATAPPIVAAPPAPAPLDPGVAAAVTEPRSVAAEPRSRAARRSAPRGSQRSEPSPEDRLPPPADPPAAAALHIADSTLWIGPELLVRPGLATSAGGALGLDLGARSGASTRLALRPPRATAWGTSNRLTEIAGDLAAWTGLGEAVRLRGGLGLSGRRYTADGQTVALHAMPQAVVGAGWVRQVGAWRLELGAGAEIDLGRTHIGVQRADEVLSPWSIRFDLKMGPAFEPETETRTPMGGPDPGR